MEGHPERVPACRDESKDLRLLLILHFATWLNYDLWCPRFLALGDRGSEILLHRVTSNP